MEALQQAGVWLEAECGGQGTCATCAVQIQDGRVLWQESRLLSPEQIEEGYVQSCQATVQSNITVMIPETAQSASDRGYIPDIAADEDIALGLEPSPLSRKMVVQIEEGILRKGGSDLQSIARDFPPSQDISWTLSPLKGLPKVAHGDATEATITVVNQDCGRSVIRIESGDTTGRHYGMACDIGTTTVALKLVDLNSGRTLEKASAYNGQMECGADVISRIIYSQKSGGLQDLHKRVLRTINRLLNMVLTKRGILPDEIVSAVFSGNTTMTHLLLGINPKYVREEPYNPAVTMVPMLAGNDLGLHVNRDAVIFLSPCVGSYVGGDITAGVLYTRHHRSHRGVALFIDIGTNGELVVMGDDWMIGCACSAGPAFEGVGIKCGMRAATGAIEGVTVKDQGDKVDFQVIGGGKPRGLCGSGLIELVAELFKNGVIGRDGKIAMDGKAGRIRSVRNQRSLVVAAAEATATGKDIVITEQDIANLMRAKAAIYSACALLLKNVGLTMSDIERVYVAGGFGSHLNFKNAVMIGLLPDIGLEKYEYLGNTSLSGAHLALISKSHRDKLLQIARSMTYIDLSSEPGYMDMYTAALFLPHTDVSLFPSLA